jgi:hypothetical protein
MIPYNKFTVLSQAIGTENIAENISIDKEKEEKITRDF